MRNILFAAIIFTVGCTTEKPNTTSDTTHLRGGGAVSDTTKQDQTTVIVPSGEAHK